MNPFRRFRSASGMQSPVKTAVHAPRQTLGQTLDQTLGQAPIQVLGRTLLTALALILCLVLLPAGAVAEEPAAATSGEAKIITGAEQPARCIAPVHIYRIDGREVKVQKLGFDLEAGQHTMSGRAVIDSSFCPAVGISRGGEDIQPLEADFEAGKTYYVGFDHSAPHRRDWKLVIWKVEGPDRT